LTVAEHASSPGSSYQDLAITLAALIPHFGPAGGTHMKISRIVRGREAVSRSLTGAEEGAAGVSMGRRCGVD